MSKTAQILLISASALLATACASTSRDTVRLEAAQTLKLAQANTQSDGSAAAAGSGLASFAFGDRYTATNLFERATADSNSVVNRFNKAAGYQGTGRTEEAAALYSELVTDGRFTRARTNPDYTRPQLLRGVNVADESARRLAAMNLPGPVSDATGAISASDLGVPASATVGEDKGSSRISDQRARQLDVANEHLVVR